LGRYSPSDNCALNFFLLRSSSYFLLPTVNFMPMVKE
jgi:hypothetical protein